VTGDEDISRECPAGLKGSLLSQPENMASEAAMTTGRKNESARRFFIHSLLWKMVDG
jgi:hypothetical protein